MVLKLCLFLELFWSEDCSILGVLCSETGQRNNAENISEPSRDSQNGWGWEGPLGITQSNPPAKEGSPGAGDKGMQPGGFGISREGDSTPSLSSCSSALPPPWKALLHVEVKILEF